MDSKSPQSRITLVLVDDNLGFQKAITAFVASLAQMVLVALAGSGTEAVQLAESLNPDVVLLDLHLPDTTGLSLIQPLHAKWPRSKFIVISFDDHPRMREMVRSAGASAFVSKVHAVEQLVPAIESVVSQSNGDNPE